MCLELAGFSKQLPLTLTYILHLQEGWTYAASPKSPVHLEQPLESRTLASCGTHCMEVQDKVNF